VLLRLTYLGVTNALAMLRLLAMSDRDNPPYLYATARGERRGFATRLLRCLIDIPHCVSDMS
jgi:hypothetical protein